MVTQIKNAEKTLSFKPKMVVKKLLTALPDRAREVVVSRYGLNDTAERQTLEAIGSMYGITRERVRQIENYALQTIRKSEIFGTEKASFDELRTRLESMGGIVCEDELLESLSKDASLQNHLHFLLVLGDAFKKRKEDTEFKHRWYADESLAEKIQGALRNLYSNLSDSDLIPEAELIGRFLTEVKDLNEKYKNDEIVRRWLSISKKLGKNPLGEWGVAQSPNVRVKGMRDYAYLVIKRHGSPMHFTEVANAIAELFNRKAHVATCHNELIKDKRFVLVGRGLYALSEWGYTSGVVKEVVADILKKHGPLTRDEIIDKVKKERYVKDNTILVNLQDAHRFKKAGDGRYALVGEA
jgi:hypothetical protein